LKAEWTPEPQADCWCAFTLGLGWDGWAPLKVHGTRMTQTSPPRRVRFRQRSVYFFSIWAREQAENEGGNAVMPVPFGDGFFLLPKFISFLPTGRPISWIALSAILVRLTRRK